VFFPPERRIYPPRKELTSLAHTVSPFTPVSEFALFTFSLRPTLAHPHMLPCRLLWFAFRKDGPTFCHCTFPFPNPDPSDLLLLYHEKTFTFAVMPPLHDLPKFPSSTSRLCFRFHQIFKFLIHVQMILPPRCPSFLHFANTNPSSTVFSSKHLSPNAYADFQLFFPRYFKYFLP